jgi:hypothetical protein
VTLSSTGEHETRAAYKAGWLGTWGLRSGRVSKIELVPKTSPHWFIKNHKNQWLQNMISENWEPEMIYRSLSPINQSVLLINRPILSKTI